MKLMNTANILIAKTKGKYSFAALLVCVCIAVSALVFSCAQDSLFADISVEPKPVDPLIKGTLTNLVIANEGGEAYLYAAGISAGKIFKYREGFWTELPAPAGRVVSLASAETGPAGSPETPRPKTLYALSGKIKGASLYRCREEDGALSWDKIEPGEDAAGFSLDVLYGAGDTIFAGGSKGNRYAVFSIKNDASSLTLVKADMSAILSGAAEAGGEYYLAAGSSGVIASSSGAVVSGSTGHEISGIMNVNGDIVAVSRGGAVLKLAGGTFTNVLPDKGPAFSGAMGIWKKWSEDTPGSGNYIWKDTLLLLGVATGGSYDKGYREIPLNSSGTLDNPSTWQEPGNPPAGADDISSIIKKNRSKYEGSIDQHNIFGIMQVPNEVTGFPADEATGEFSNPNGWEPVIFATTTSSGLMSLRGGLWNFEDD